MQRTWKRRASNSRGAVQRMKKVYAQISLTQEFARGAYLLQESQSAMIAAHHEVLAVIDDRVARRVVQVAEAAANQSAQISHAQHVLSLSQSRHDRLHSLNRTGSVTTYEIEEAFNDVRQAQASLQVAKQKHVHAQRQLELEQSRLESHTIRAPFDGKVVQVRATIGETIQGGNELLTLASLETLKVELHLPLEHYGRLRSGTEYELIADAPVNKKIVGRLRFISPNIDSPTKTFRCVFTIRNMEILLPSGFDVRLLDLPPGP